MNLAIIALFIFDYSLLLLTESNNIDSILWESNEVIILREHNTHDLTLPELKSLMPEQSWLHCSHWIGDIQDLDIIGVDIDDFVWNHKLSTAICFYYKNISVCKVKFVFPFEHESVFFEVVCVKSDKEQP